MRVFQIGLMLLLLSLTGCMSDYAASAKSFGDREAFLEYLMAGYVTDTPSLYLDDWNGKRSRLEGLHKAFGVNNPFTFYTMNRGQLLVFETDESDLQANELGTLVLSVDAPPKLIRSPEELWAKGKRRVLHSHERSDLLNERGGLRSCPDFEMRFETAPSVTFNVFPNEHLQFYNGHILDGPAVACIDKEQRFICYRKPIKKEDRDGDSIKGPGPLTIISVDHPEIRTESRLSRFPRTMVANNGKLYLATQTNGKEVPPLHFEVFDISGGRLDYVKDYYVEPPWGSAAGLCVIYAYDYQTNSQLINVWRRWPFRNQRYLYRYGDNSLEKAPYGAINFIDPDIFKNSVKYIDLEKLR